MSRCPRAIGQREAILGSTKLPQLLQPAMSDAHLLAMSAAPAKLRPRQRRCEYVPPFDHSRA
eukprot:7181331-Pyramimonas_sp.AAC.1